MGRVGFGSDSIRCGVSVLELGGDRERVVGPGLVGLGSTRAWRPLPTSVWRFWLVGDVTGKILRAVHETRSV